MSEKALKEVCLLIEVGDLWDGSEETFLFVVHCARAEKNVGDVAMVAKEDILLKRPHRRGEVDQCLRVVVV